MEKNILKITVLCLFLFSCSLCFSQQITGTILDGETNIPIENASIYFDNTTIGSVSNSKGEFIIEYNPNIHSPLIISFLGYKIQTFTEFDVDEKMEVYLFEEENSLDVVLIDANDGWSRELKLKEFRKHYLGESDNGKSCKILNEDNLILRYDKRKKRLIAKTKGAIIIKNKNLKYNITVDLDHFEVNYSHVSKNKKRLSMNYVFYSGANFYKSTQDDPSKNTLKKRNEAYKGSVLHFMRSLAQKKLSKNGYQIYLGHNPVNPNRYISVFDVEEGSNNVYVRLKDRLNILYKSVKQSSVESFVDRFHIDHFGNHSPPDKVQFGGDLGMQRMGDALPLDFLLIKYKRSKDL